MPSDAKFSPVFQEVRPATVPPHSFCQIRFPIRRVSAGVRLIAARALSAIASSIRVRSGASRVEAGRAERLDEGSFFSSVAVPAAPRCNSPTAPGLILLMKRLIICLSAACLASIGLAQDKAQLKDQKDKASYSIGYDIGETCKKQNVDLNADTLFGGLKDALAGKEAALNKEEREKTLQALQKEMMEKQIAASKEAATKNSAEGEKFLAENKKKEGVKTTASGLQYKVLKEGSGESPKETDTVVTNYRGTLLDGTEFDSSYKRNEPATFPVNRVIKGWTEALLMMKPGSKYQLFIPSALGYGERGVGKDIGPNSTLIFEVELLSIKPPEASPTPGAAGNKASTPAAAAPPAPITKPSSPP